MAPRVLIALSNCVASTWNTQPMLGFERHYLQGGEASRIQIAVDPGNPLTAQQEGQLK